MAKKTAVPKAAYAWALARISIGLVFLWAFFDKLFGLGFATCRNADTMAIDVMCDKAWLAGGSPTSGFLKFGTSGPFADFYQSLAGNSFIDWIFMVGLLGIGVGLTLGIAMKLSVITGSLMLLMMWTAALWPANNPIIDDHIVYIFVLLGLLLSDSTQAWGLRSWWMKQPLAQKASWLR